MNASLSSLCWGFRGLNCNYGGVSYDVTPLLNDLHVGGVWYLEPHLTASFIKRGEGVKFKGTFRHTSYIRFDKSGKGFPDVFMKYALLFQRKMTSSNEL